MSPDAVKRRLDGLFVWTRDREQFGRDEDWRSHIAAYRAGEIVRDDCDGYMMTAADALLDAGADPATLRLVTCTTETGEGHAVCAVDQGGETLILDNRQRAVWTWGEMVQAGYRFDRSMRLSEPGVWREAG